MTNYTKKRFSVGSPMTDEYGDNYERIFGKKRVPGKYAAPEVRTSPGTLEVARSELEKWELELRSAWDGAEAGAPGAKEALYVAECIRMVLEASR